MLASCFNAGSVCMCVCDVCTLFRCSSGRHEKQELRDRHRTRQIKTKEASYFKPSKQFRVSLKSAPIDDNY